MSFPSLPFSSSQPISNLVIPLPSPSLLQRLGGLWERYSSPAGQGPAAKRIFVQFTAQNLHNTCVSHLGGDLWGPIV